VSKSSKICLFRSSRGRETAGLTADGIVSWLVLLLVTLLLSLGCFSTSAAESQFTKLGLDKTNVASAQTGWLQLPSKAVVLSIHHEPLVPACRHQASQLTLFIIQELVHADYTVYLSSSFTDDEIRYYKSLENVEESASRILSCLEAATNSRTLDWDCLRAASAQGATDLTDDNNFPWSQPPKNSNLVLLAEPDDRAIPELSLNVHWLGRRANGVVGFSSSMRSRETAPAFSGKSVLWNPSATLRLGTGPSEIFRKHYSMQEWKDMYHQSSDTPLQVTILAILEDIRAGLKPKPEGVKPKSNKSAK